MRIALLFLSLRNLVKVCKMQHWNRWTERNSNTMHKRGLRAMEEKMDWREEIV